MVEIQGLPRDLRSIPEYAPDWIEWAEGAALYRISIRHEIERDLELRDVVVTLSAADPLYDMLMFGSTFEPRDRLDRPKGWYPMIPFSFQARLVRTVQDVLNTVPGTAEFQLGRQDLVIEKARGMTGTVTLGAIAAHRWKYDDGFLAAFMSYRFEDVEKEMDATTIFYKIESYLGLVPQVPEFRAIVIAGAEEIVPIRSPAWMIPEGFIPKLHNKTGLLAHPSRSNQIAGTATTKLAGTSKRVTMWVTDEAAKYAGFPAAYQNLSSVTDHRVVLSSADLRHGAGFRDLAASAETARKRGTNGPTFIRLRKEEHPLQDADWEEAMHARHENVPGAVAAFAREYDLDYEAGATNVIYPEARTLRVEKLTYSPSHERLDFVIDPGIRNMCAFHLIKYDPSTDTYGLMLSYANNAKGADFYASLVLAKPLNQFYEYGPEELRVMAFFETYGRRISTFLGDPAGNNKVTGKEGKLKSFYDDFREATELLSENKISITIWSSNKPQFKQTDFRHRSMRKLIRKLIINDEPDTELTKKAIGEHHFPDLDDMVEKVVVAKEPVRFWGHDRVLACEYYAAFVDLGMLNLQANTTGRGNVAPATRVTTSGKKRGTGYAGVIVRR